MVNLILASPWFQYVNYFCLHLPKNMVTRECVKGQARMVPEQKWEPECPSAYRRLLPQTGLWRCLWGKDDNLNYASVFLKDEPIKCWWWVKVREDLLWSLRDSFWLLNQPDTFPRTKLLVLSKVFHHYRFA